MNVLLLSAYDAESHKRWRKGVMAHLSDIHFTCLTLPARYFSWRIRGNALTWALGHRATLISQRWDWILATSMVDLAVLKGLVPELANVPSILYFHENQFAYPLGHSANNSAHNGVEPQMVSLYSAIAADKLVFNSDYNRETFLTGVDALLKKLPDHVPRGIVNRLKEKSQILPVPIETKFFELANRRVLENSKYKPLTILWNHRWEYDKGPQALFNIILACANHCSSTPMRWHIVGQQFRQSPDIFGEIKSVLEAKNWLGAWGHQSSADYPNVLVDSDIVLSTALHDFQGLAVMDAVAAGAEPLLPRALAYPEFFPSEYLYEVHDMIGEQSFDQQKVSDGYMAISTRIARGFEVRNSEARNSEARNNESKAVKIPRWSHLEEDYRSLFW